MLYEHIEVPISLEHTRARFAYNSVNTTIGNLTDPDRRKEFKSWAAKFPSMISSCGLLQAATFYKEKNEKLYTILQDWFKKTGFLNDDQGLLDYLMNHCTDTYHYILMVKEAIEFLSWVKRFANILVPGTTNEPQDINQGEQNA